MATRKDRIISIANERPSEGNHSVKEIAERAYGKEVTSGELDYVRAVLRGAGISFERSSQIINEFSVKGAERSADIRDGITSALSSSLAEAKSSIAGKRDVTRRELSTALNILDVALEEAEDAVDSNNWVLTAGDIELIWDKVQEINEESGKLLFKMGQLQ
mgnify:CR=1 FL=1